MKRLWGRIGMDFLLSDRDFQCVCDEETVDEIKGKIIIDAINTGKGIVCGSTYFPGTDSMGCSENCDNPSNDIDLTIYDEKKEKTLLYPFLKKPYKRTEVLRRCSPEGEIVGIVEVELSELIDRNMDEFLDLISNRMTGDFTLHSLSYSVVGYNQNTLLLLVRAYLEIEENSYLDTDEFENELLPDELFFISTSNSWNIIYSAKKEDKDYKVKWTSDRHKFEEWYLKSELILNIKNGTFIVCDEKGNTIKKKCIIKR